MKPKRRHSLLFRYGLTLAVTSALASAQLAFHPFLKGHSKLAPLVTFSYLLTMIGAAWWGGYLAGLLVLFGAFAALLYASHGYISLYDIQPVSFGACLLLSLVVSWVAASRKKLEQFLRYTNERLEIKVRERTAELERAREWLEITLASIGDGVIAADQDGRVTMLNAVAESLTGWHQTEAAGVPLDAILNIIDEQSRARIETPTLTLSASTALAGLSGRTALVSRQGHEVSIEASAAPIVKRTGEAAGVVLILRDVTERRCAELERERLNREMLATEERLRETAKLESLGVLAGGIAHDFNNLLVGVLGNSSLAQAMLPPESPVVPVLADVISASEKAAQLTHQMLAYSGKGRFVVEHVDLSREIDDILPLISRTIPKMVSVRLLLGRNLPAIEADKSQLQQVLMNLIINAAEACGTQPGMVTVATRVAALTSDSIAPAFGLGPVPAGDFVCLEIKDTGCGMPDEVKSKIFDPFFTTKFTGRGLGLSAVLGIVRSHKGAVQVESAAGAGTTFRIFFPVAADHREEEKLEPTAEANRKGTGTVLIIDDEEIVRKMARTVLQQAGYQVLLAEDGESGVQAFTENAGRISAVLLDLTMPVMDGETALARIRDIHPTVRVILSSGFDETELAERFNGKGLAGFLQKPYTARKLLQQVRSVTGLARPAQKP